MWLSQTPMIEASRRKESNIQQVVNHFFVLKGWPTKEDALTAGIVYARYVRPAKTLLKLCREDVDRACWTLDSLRAWAEVNHLSWTLDTAIKRWYDLPRQAEAGNSPRDQASVRISSGLTPLKDLIRPII